MPFRSKAQWRWAFATHQRFARKWAHKTPSFKALPVRKTLKGVGSARRRRAGM